MAKRKQERKTTDLPQRSLFKISSECLHKLHTLCTKEGCRCDCHKNPIMERYKQKKAVIASAAKA